MSSRRVSTSLACLALAEVGAAIVLAVAAGLSFSDALDGFVLTNGVMGLSFAACGGVIGWYQPRHAVGRLFVADGLGHATGALAVPVAELVHKHHGPIWVERAAATVLQFSWPWSIALFLPLALLLVPDGRTASPAWRPIAWAVGLTAPLFVLEAGLDPSAVADGLPSGYLTVGWYDKLAPLWVITELRTSAALLLGVICLVVRFRRGDEVRRRQLLWLVLAAVVVIGVVIPWSFVSGTPTAVLFAIPLIPIAVAVGIVRAQLLDIRLVVSRTLAWGLLSLAALVGYVLLVAAFDTFVSARVGKSAIVTVLVALGLAPVLPRLQRLVDRWMYGARKDPALVATRVGERLRAAGPADGLDGVVMALREALRLPYVAVVGPQGDLAAAGDARGGTAVVPLSYAGLPVGDLVVGLRAGERRLSPADRATLDVVAASLAVAVRAIDLSAEVSRSRERLVMAREEERRRIRQDLHDGLGAALTGIALSADAVANLAAADPATAATLLDELRHNARGAIADVRRIVDDLRPPALDELGLVGALRQRVDQLSWRSDGSMVAVRLDAPDPLPTLPAAVEVAAYRITTEALTNVARHSAARGAVVSLRCQDALVVEVLDDGGLGGPWRPGVGLNGMRERAAELGGSFEAGPCATGGRVYVSLPLDAA